MIHQSRVAGMGADLFGSYVATILASMVLGREIVSNDNFGGIAPVLLPLVIAGMGVWGFFVCGVGGDVIDCYLVR